MPQHKFKSKVGLELLIPLLFVLGVVLWMVLYEAPHWSLSLALTTIVAGVIALLFSINYVVENETLIVHYGMGYKKHYAIKDMKAISRSNNVLSAPAASLDRLEITFYNGDFLLLSPKDKIAFIEAIKRIHPALEDKT